MSPSSTPPLAPEPPIEPGGLDELLADAMELAIGVARRDVGQPGGTPPPVSLRPYLRFSRFPPRARTAVLAALDEDDAFRDRVAAGAEESSMSRASWLFLRRPEGWAEEFGALRELAAQDQAVSESTREEHSARRRLAQVSELADRMRAERDDAVAALDAAHAETGHLGRERADLHARLEDLGAQRAEAVRQLKDQELLAVARLEESQALRARVSELEAALAANTEPAPNTEPAAAAETTSTAGTATSPAPGDGAPQRTTDAPAAATPTTSIDQASLAAAIAEAARDAAGLAASLGAAAAALQAPADAVAGNRAPTAAPSDRPADAAAAERAATRRAPRRRVPQRMRGGVIEDSAEGVLQLLNVPDQVLIVDGYNVSMEGWPQLDGPQQRQSLLDALASVQTRGEAAIHVVFDGVDASTPRRSGSPVRVHFTDSDTEADDRILAMVQRIDPGTPVTVISSDRRVADGARAAGANTARSAAMLALMRS